MDTKQVIVIRKDLHMRRGKEIAQGSHASMGWLSDRIIHHGKNSAEGYGDEWKVGSLVELSPAEYDWLSGAHTKIVCQVPDLETLLTVWNKAKEAGVNTYLVTDAGYTEFHGEATETAVAVGPDRVEVIDKITKDLELY